MVNAAEAAIMGSAEDEKGRARLKAQLYAPPKGSRRPQGGRARPPGMRMTRGQAGDLLAAAAVQDAQAGRG